MTGLMERRLVSRSRVLRISNRLLFGSDDYRSGANSNTIVIDGQAFRREDKNEAYVVLFGSLLLRERLSDGGAPSDVKLFAIDFCHQFDFRDAKNAGVVYKDNDEWTGRVRTCRRALRSHGVKMVTDVAFHDDGFRSVSAVACTFGPETWSAFCEKIANSKTIGMLKISQLSFSKISRNGDGSASRSSDSPYDSLSLLCKALQTNTSITNLNIDYCGLDEATMLPVARLLASKDCQIQSLYLDHNNCCPDALRTLIEYGLRQNRTLKVLSLSHNPIADDGVEYLVDFLRDFASTTAIHRLWMFDCDIWRRGGRYIAEHLRENLPTLQSLTLDGPELEGSMDILQSSMAANKTLKHLYTMPGLDLSDTDRQHWGMIRYYLRLNLANRRAIEHAHSIPAAIWPGILAQTKQAQSDVMYHMIRHVPDLFQETRKRDREESLRI